MLSIECVIVELGSEQGLARIFVRQNLGVRVGHFCRYTFEDRIAQWKDFFDAVFVLVLAFDYICIVFVVRRESGDVQEEAVLNIYESSVDDVIPVATYPLPRPRIDVQQITSSNVE